VAPPPPGLKRPGNRTKQDQPSATDYLTGPAPSWMTCPLMMMFMMFGTHGGPGGADQNEHRSRAPDDHDQETTGGRR
jgi:hypothetical protein